MSLFRTIPSAGDFAPLFHLLDDYDVHCSTKGAKPTSIRSYTPRFDVRETADAYHLDGELPGTVQKDINIEFSDPQTLVIKGHSEPEYHRRSENNEATTCDEEDEVSKSDEKKQQKSSQPKPRYWVNERTVGDFQRTFSFPTRVDQESVKASLKNGVLSLVVPKAAAPSVKKITIE